VSSESTPEKLPVPVDGLISDLDQSFRLAQALATSALLPGDVRGKPADVLAILLYGRELGIGPMQALSTIYAVKGRPMLSADLWRAKAHQAGHKTWFTDDGMDNEKATFHIQRRGEQRVHALTYTIQHAAQAGLCRIGETGQPIARSAKGDKLPWETQTSVMLRNRATSQLAKMVCPEVALGFYIEGDILDDEPDQTTTVEQIVEPVEIDVTDARSEVQDIEKSYAEEVDHIAKTMTGEAVEVDFWGAETPYVPEPKAK
jgi:hypothetical protein